jgi:hypothetical protein
MVRRVGARMGGRVRGGFMAPSLGCGVGGSEVAERRLSALAWQLPKTAHGKHFTGTIADTYKGAKISRSFSVTVV